MYSKKKFKLFSLVLILILQIAGGAGIFESHPSSQSDQSVQSIVLSTDHVDQTSSQTTKQDQPIKHQHCQGHTVGSCCPFVLASTAIVAPIIDEELFTVRLDFLFFQLSSSDIRPPSLHV